MDVAAQHLVGVLEDGLGVVGEDDLHLGPVFPDELGVELHIVHAGEGVQHLAEQRAVLRFGQGVAVGVDPLLVEQVLIDQVVADLVGGEAEHQHDFLCAARDAF